jgi:hypothetical protein
MAYIRTMEFIEAPASMTSCLEQEDFGSFAGLTRGAAREEKAVYG